ncbi:hypothetical protein Ancab_032956 [Ancistrocladus abbreviatus]
MVATWAPHLLLFEVAWARHETSSAAVQGRLGLPSGAVRGGMGSLFRTIGTLAAVAITANSARGMKDSATATATMILIPLVVVVVVTLVFLVVVLDLVAMVALMVMVMVVVGVIYDGNPCGDGNLCGDGVGRYDVPFYHFPSIQLDPLMAMTWALDVHDRSMATTPASHLLLFEAAWAHHSVPLAPSQQSRPLQVE